MSIRILYNGLIHTQNPGAPLVSALAIDSGQIIAVGDEQYLLDCFPFAENRHNLHGSTVIPGLTDAHIHLQNYALGLQKINCENLTKADCLQKVAEKARQSQPGTWILGHGWNQNDWEDGFGTAADLDKVAPANPVYLSAKSLHSAWVNTQALKLAKIESSTSLPPADKIQRDNHGNPTGIFFENAIELISAVIPEPSQEDVITAILKAQEILLKMGVTSVHDFDRAVCFSALQEIQARGQLKLRVIKTIPLEALPFAADLGLHSGFGNDHLRIGGVKIFMDGALGPHTAAMILPYENELDNQGMLFMDNEELFQHGKFAVDHGLALAIHAIGDRANHETLNALERLRKYERLREPVFKPRHRIEHVQILHPLDIPRLASMDIIASMQPVHAVSDMTMADQHWGSRSEFAYAWKSQIKSGAVLAFGSDAPVESPNPFWGIHAAVTRQRADGSPGSDGWYPKQRLSVDEALRAYTIGPAYAAGMEDRLGKLAPGYLADLLVLDQDLFQQSPDEIREIHPLATMIGGKWMTENL